MIDKHPRYTSPWPCGAVQRLERRCRAESLCPVVTVVPAGNSWSGDDGPRMVVAGQNRRNIQFSGLSVERTPDNARLPRKCRLAKVRGLPSGMPPW